MEDVWAPSSSALPATLATAPDLSPADPAALATFLMTLNNNKLVTDERFSDPFGR